MLFLELCGCRSCLLLTVPSVKLHGYLRTRTEERDDFHVSHDGDIINRHDIHGICHGHLQDVGILLVETEGHQLIFLHQFFGYELDRIVVDSYLTQVNRIDTELAGQYIRKILLRNIAEGDQCLTELGSPYLLLLKSRFQLCRRDQAFIDHQVADTDFFTNYGHI